MATYAIGDVQGCYRSLMALLDQISFGADDCLWFAGDLVNRGPDSLSVLRFVKELGAQAQTVLGNHDLHLLAIHSGEVERKAGRTLKPVLSAPDCDELMAWLITQPLAIESEPLGALMTHAGVPHIWSRTELFSLTREVEEALRSDPAEYFRHMYGNDPDLWNDQLSGPVRLRVITNYLTRMRFISPEGKLDFDANAGPETAPLGFLPWYECARNQPLERRVYCGHWAALGFHRNDLMIGLDTGCVWGNRLTAVRLEDQVVFSVPSQDLH